MRSLPYLLLLKSTLNPVEALGGVVRAPMHRVRADSPFAGTISRLRLDAGGSPPASELVKVLEGYGYACEVGIGTPPQSIDALFDTGSSDLWVNPTCANTVFKDICEMSGQYDPEASSTSQDLNETFYVGYGSGAVVGEVYTDSLNIAGSDLEGVRFGVADESRTIPLAIFGTGFGKGRSTRYNSVLDEMFEQGVIAKREFSVYLNDLDEPTGEVVFGGVDTRKYSGPLLGIPILDPIRGDQAGQRYLVRLTSIETLVPRSSENCTSTLLTGSSFSAPVLFDTGSTITYAPAAYIDAIADALPGAEYVEGTGMYSVPCAAKTDETIRSTVKFGFGGVAAEMPVRKLIFTLPPGLAPDSVPQCWLGLFPTTFEPFYIFGDVFLRSFYTVFSQDDMAIYLAPFVECGSDLVTCGSGAADLVGKCDAKPGLTCTSTGTTTSLAGFTTPTTLPRTDSGPSAVSTTTPRDSGSTSATLTSVR